MKKNTKTQTTSKLRIGLILSLFLILQQAEATSYDIQDIPEKSSGSLFSAEEFNNMMGVSRSWIRDDNNTFGNAVTHVGENFTDDTLTTQAKIHAKELQIDGQVVASSFIGDGSALTGIDTGKWDNATGGINYSGGKVGIGTNTPSGQFHLASDFNGDNVSRFMIGNGASNSIGWIKTLNAEDLTQQLTLSAGESGSTDGAFLALHGKEGNVSGVGKGSVLLEAARLSTEGRIQLRTKGLNRMIINEDGNVGIGTASPVAKLHVYTTTSTDGITLAGTNAPALTIKNDTIPKAYLGLATTDGNWDGASKAGDIVLRTEGGALRVNTNSGNGTGVFTVLGSNGNVGIGTTNPSYKLDINGTTRLGNTTYIGGEGMLTFSSDIGGGERGIILQGNAGKGVLIRGGATGTDLIVKSNGNIGIGTPSPSQKLDVAGTVKATAFVGDGSGLTGLSSGGKFVDGASSANAVYTAGNVGIGTTSPNEKLQVEGNLQIRGSAVGQGIFGRYAAGSNAHRWSIVRQNNGASNADLSISAYTGVGISGGQTTGSKTSAYHLYVNSTGNIGIGTTTPSRKLDVNGYIRLTGGEIINNTSPTIYLQDTDHRSGMIHMNSNYMYFLRGSGTNSTGWAAYNGKWPLTINMENNNATFGGTVSSDYLVVQPQNTVGEGGELQLIGSGGGGHIQIDNYLGNARIHTLAVGKEFQVLGGGASIGGNIRTSQNIHANSYCDENGGNCKTAAQLGGGLIIVGGGEDGYQSSGGGWGVSRGCNAWGQATCAGYANLTLTCPSGSTKRKTGENTFNDIDFALTSIGVYLCIKN